MGDDLQSRMDYLYRLFLKDEHALLDRMNALKDEFPAAANSMGDQLNTQTGHLLVAAEKLAGVLQSMAAEVDRTAAQAAAQAGEAAKLDVRKAATEAASVAIGDTVGAEVNKLVSQLHAAGVDLDKKAGEASTKITRAMSMNTRRLVGVAVFCSLVSTGAALAGVHYLQGKGGGAAVGAAVPDQETAKQIEAGRDFLQVLPQLDKPTKDKLIRMIQDNRAGQRK